MKRILCARCGASLGNTEIALNLKLRGRAVGTFYCLDCLAGILDSDRAALTRLADHFRENGCELFARQYVLEQGSDER